MNPFKALKLWGLFKKAEKEIQMDGVKSFLTSKTLWGIVTMLVPLVAQKTGLAADIIAGTAADVIQIAGAVLGVIGRFTAKKELVIVGDK